MRLTGNDETNFHGIIITATIKRLREDVKQYSPACEWKNFLLWMLNDSNSLRGDYLQLMGVLKTVDLEVELLAHIIRASDYLQAAKYIAIFNVHFFFEVISDNLSAGLAGMPKKDDKSYDLRKSVVGKFNLSVITKLKGSTSSAIELIRPYENDMRQLSVYEQNLFPGELKRFSNKYCNGNAQLENALEYSLFPILVLNIETCNNATRAISDHPLSAMLMEKVIARYKAMNKLILNNNKPLPLKELLDLGKDTILVIGTYCYFIALIDQFTRNKNLKVVIENGFLPGVLCMASGSTRLTNDMGGQLVLYEEDKLKILSKELSLSYQKSLESGGISDASTFSEFFNQISLQDKYKRLLTRLNKDSQHGEYNIVLDNIRDMTDIPKAIGLFIENVKYYSSVYKRQKRQLKDDLNKLSEDLMSSNVSDIIFGYVSFHEKLYSKEFETGDGEYAAPLAKKNADTNKKGINQPVDLSPKLSQSSESIFALNPTTVPTTDESDVKNSGPPVC